jgi:CBS domain-containing protein
MIAREVMTTDPACCTPADSVREAARLMREHDCGCIPVVEDQGARKLVGVVTDRDIAMRCVCEGEPPETAVRHAMSADPSCCAPEDEVETARRIMEERQVRRVPVVDGDGCCVGMISQADLARNDDAVSNRQMGRTLERISEPADGAVH